MKYKLLLLLACVFATKNNAYIEFFLCKMMKRINTYMQKQRQQNKSTEHSFLMAQNNKNASQTASRPHGTPPPAPYHQSTALFHKTELLKFLKERLDKVGSDSQFCRYDIAKTDCKDRINEYAILFVWYTRLEGNLLTDFEINTIKKWFEETISKKSSFVENFADMHTTLNGRWMSERNLDPHFQSLYCEERDELLYLRNFYHKIFHSQL